MAAQLTYCKILLRTTLVLILCLLTQRESFATHISGAEIFYKHLNGNNYKFTLKVYRDCRECKFNNIGGGDNTSSCNEVPDLIIKGAIGTSYANTTIGTVEISRVSIQDLSNVCFNQVSKCRPNSTSAYGFEVHTFEGTFDFSSAINNGQCKLDVSIGMSARNINLNNQFTEQNFFNYTSLNLCEGIANSSTEFTSSPTFLHQVNQSNYQSLGVINPDGDSLVFSLKPALRNRTVSVSYTLGYDYDYPFSFYCSGGFPCAANINGTTVEGFYLSKTTGDLAFTPNLNNQSGVIVVECEEFKKRSDGTYFSAGITRRDIYSDVITQNNNLPRIKNRILEYQVCEGDELTIDLDIDDLPVLGNPGDTVYTDVISTLPGTIITRVPKNGAPFFYYTVRTGSTINKVGKHYITVLAKDNNCPLRGISSKTFVINVLKSRIHKIATTMKNCGTLEVVSSTMPTTALYWTILDDKHNIIRQQQSRKVSIQLPKGGKYYINSFLPANGVYCELNQKDSIIVKDFTKPEINMGADVTICKGSDFNLQPQILNTYDKFDILINGVKEQMPYKYVANAPKSFIVRVTQDNGCWSEDNINVNLFPVLNYKVSNDTFCLNSVFPAPVKNIQVDKAKIFAIDLNSNNANSNIHQLNAFDWEIDLINRISHKQTVHSLIIDKNLCHYIDTFTIDIVEPDPINVVVPNAICINSEPINLPSTKTGIWQSISRPDLVKNNRLTLDIADKNAIELLYTEKVQCLNSAYFTIQIKDTTALGFGHGTDLKICESQSPFKLIGLPAGGTWIGENVSGNDFLADKAAGKTTKLMYQYSNLSDCISEASIDIAVEKLPLLYIEPTRTKICVGDVLSLSAKSNTTASGYWYTDGDGSFDQAGSAKTNYTPKQTDVSKPFINFVYTLQTNGICGNVSVEVMAIVKNGQVGEIVKNYPTTVCEPASFNFKTTFKNLEKQYWLINDSTYEIFDYNFDFNPVLKAGEYVVKTMVNDSTCEAMAISEVITVLPKPDVKWLANPTVKMSKEFPRLYLKDLTECKHGHTVNWYINNEWLGNNRELNFKVEDKGDTFFIKLVSASGKGDCKDSLTQMFYFAPINQLFIPSGFSPDSKGPNENNVFKVVGVGIKNFKIEIFNRFGEKVYMSNDINTFWDGTYKNQTCMQGDYFYKIETTDIEGISRDYSGTVTLIR